MNDEEGLPTPRSLSRCSTDPTGSDSGSNRIVPLASSYSSRPSDTKGTLQRSTNGVHIGHLSRHRDDQTRRRARGSELAIAEGRQKHEAAVIATNNRRPPMVSCRPVQQAQILSSFLELHFPSKAAKADLAHRRSWLLGLPEVDLAEAPLLRNAVDTVCYAHLGSQQKDNRLQQEARHSYGRVLCGLMQELERPRNRHDPKHITAAMMLLCLYDDALPQPQSAVSGWAAHYLGAQEFLRACGPTTLDLSVPFDRLIFMNLRVPSIFPGIARRRAVMLGQPEWIAFGQRNAQANHSLAVLYGSALQIPGVMEEAERLIDRRGTDQDLLALFTKIQQLQDSMHSWITTRSAMASYWGKHLTDVVYLSDSEAFDMTVEEQCVMESNTAFLSHYRFADYRMAQDFTLYLVFMMVLNCTLLRLLHYRPESGPHHLRRTAEDVGRDAFATASDMCRTIHCQSGFESQGIAGFIELLTALSQAFFEEIGAADKIGWCQTVRCATQLRMERLRSTQPKTLCRVGDLTEDFAAVGRFKMRDPMMSWSRRALADPAIGGCPVGRS